MLSKTVSNDANGKIKFSALEYKRGEEGNHVYTVEEVKVTMQLLLMIRW